MSRILGLDMGSGSVGWAVINENDGKLTIEAMGSRIIPLSPDDVKEFTTGNAISKNAARTAKRTQRKGYDRYQLRRKELTNFLREHSMTPTAEQIEMPQLELWGLRAKAVAEPLSLTELGRVLYHLNQKRGYKSAKDDTQDTKQRDYVATVMKRHTMIREEGLTIGQYFYQNLALAAEKKTYFRTKEQVFPRKAYVEEFDAIIEMQRQSHPSVLTEGNVERLRNEIIYYQRALKSCKHLVSMCEFEMRRYKNAEGRIVENGPKVAPRSSPLAQVCKIWESVNNMVLKNNEGEALSITLEQRMEIFQHLNTNDRITMTDLYRILGIRKAGGWWGGKAIGAKNMGNMTRMALQKAIGDDYADLLRFDLKVVETVDKQTGEVYAIVSDDFQNEPLYRLWHVVYSISDYDELKAALEKQFSITERTIVDNLYQLDFTKAGYANKSARAMRRILPYLERELKYSEACEAAGFRHSESLNNEERAARQLSERLKQLQKNELRQPIVEKVLNQMINVVNALMDKYGAFDEIRVELARELKQSRDERYDSYVRMGKNQRDNTAIANRITEESRLTPTRSRIQKYKMWVEADEHCFYCGKNVGVVEFLKGFDVEVEHVIPKSLFFDDGFSNKVCSCRACNKEKNNRTAFDYMNSKPESEFKAYLERIEKLFVARRISKTKYERLLTPGDKIPTDFIDRQLRESQYIARKSREILSEVCRNVTATSGGVTDYVRRVWGWDRVLHDLNFDRYKAAGLTKVEERRHRDNSFEEEVIVGWNKRDDHRHHAIDALVIACTTQAIIKRLNDLSTLKDVQFQPLDAQGREFKERQSQLERFMMSMPHFSHDEVCRAAEGIFVSFKAGKKAATLGKRYIRKNGKRVRIQSGVIIPRGPLSEESVYGKIVRPVKNRKGETVNQSEYVIKYTVGVAFDKTDKVVDQGVRRILEARLAKFGGNPKLAFKAVEGVDGKLVEWYEDEGLARPIISARCYTGLSAVVPVKYDENGEAIGYVKPGNNHHVAIYVDKDGKRQELVATFWHAVERQKYGLPAIIANPTQAWDLVADKNLPSAFLEQLPDPSWMFVMSMQQNEMFVLGLTDEAFDEAIRTNDYKILSQNLYRVQKLSTKNYYFRLHIETKVDDKYGDKVDVKLSVLVGKMLGVQSLGRFAELNPRKVKITLLGEIIEQK